MGVRKREKGGGERESERTAAVKERHTPSAHRRSTETFHLHLLELEV